MISFPSKVSNLHHIGAQPPRSVTSFCSVIVWMAPTRAYGVITGYEVSFSLAGGDNSVIVSKNSDKLFHVVRTRNLPHGEGDILVMVSIYLLHLVNSLYLEN